MRFLRACLALCILTLATAFLLPVHLFCLKFSPKTAARLASRWHVLSSAALGVRVQVYGAPHPGPALFLSNHVSWLDIVTFSRIQPLSFVAKAEVADWPVVSALARWQRSVFVKREERRDTGRAFMEMAARLKAGDTLVLFAEGTTSDGWQVLPFKSSLIGAAIQASHQLEEEKPLYVQPVAICYSRLHGIALSRMEAYRIAWIGNTSLLPYIKDQLKNGGLDVEIAFGNAVPVYADTDRKVLTRRIENEVKQLLQSLRQQSDGHPVQNVLRVLQTSNVQKASKSVSCLSKTR